MADAKIENDRFLEVEKLTKKISDLTSEFSEDIMSIYRDHDPDAGIESIALCLLVISKVNNLRREVLSIQKLLKKDCEMMKEPSND